MAVCRKKVYWMQCSYNCERNYAVISLASALLISLSSFFVFISLFLSAFLPLSISTRPFCICRNSQGLCTLLVSDGHARVRVRVYVISCQPVFKGTFFRFIPFRFRILHRANFCFPLVNLNRILTHPDSIYFFPFFLFQFNRNIELYVKLRSTFDRIRREQRTKEYVHHSFNIFYYTGNDSFDDVFFARTFSNDKLGEDIFPLSLSLFFSFSRFLYTETFTE